MVYYFFNKRSSDSSVTHALSETLVLRDKSAIKVEIMLNQQLAENLSKKIIRKFNERKGYLCFKDNAQGGGIVFMQLIIKCSAGFQFFVCVIETCSKYAYNVLKLKKVIAITNAFQKKQMN